MIDTSPWTIPVETGTSGNTPAKNTIIPESARGTGTVFLPRGLLLIPIANMLTRVPKTQKLKF
jgi:hypothetical protein